ncbi:MAG TPA: hypothetical protein VLX56_07180 [Nitrososphaerales archaeon]|nr:hypothetical protein [Nitrososphaerales archaeon]
MSQLSPSPAGREGVMVLGGVLAAGALRALADEPSRRILASALSGAKKANEISEEQAIPMSSCYRKIHELVEQGLLVVDRIFVTGDGKRYATYRSTFKSVEMVSDTSGIMVYAELNEAAAEKFRQQMLHISGAS